MFLLISIFFLSSCAADLRVKDLAHSPANPTTADQITFSALVENAGNTASAPSELSFKVGGETYPPRFAVPALASGSTCTVQRRLVLGVAQNYQNTVIVDVNNAVAESNEGNNQAVEYYTVVEFNIGDWLNSHAAVAASIQWERPSATPNDMIAYPAWTTAMKNDLAQACRAVVRGRTAGLPPVPDTELTLDGAGNVWAVQVQKDLAWRYYTAYVAQSLMAEVQGWFPWSLSGYNPQALAALFDSRTLFGWGTGPQRYTVKKMHNILHSQGMATPSDPGTTLQMIESLGLVGATPMETLDKIFAWSRDNLVHFYGSETPDNNLAHWGFRGYPPVQRILEGTNRQIAGGGAEFGHWTAGCWGTTAFITLTGKVLNIPVELVKLRSGSGYHAAPHFIAEGRYWSHGDDPYNWLSREFIPATSPAPPREYFIDEATYQSWFGAAVSDADSGRGIGRRVAQVAVQYVTDYLLQKHCYDLSHGTGHAASLVYSSLSPFYTVAELEAQNLWVRLDQKIADLGGCAGIP